MVPQQVICEWITEALHGEPAIVCSLCGHVKGTDADNPPPERYYPEEAYICENCKLSSPGFLEGSTAVLQDDTSPWQDNAIRAMEDGER
jgi:hypothetical protein